MTARELAAQVLLRVEGGAYATLALTGELNRARTMSGPDRALATELVYGVLKQRRRLDYALAQFAPRGLSSLDSSTLDALRLGAYQLLFLRIPAHAAVDQTVGAVKRGRGAKLAGFVNALLRRLAREGEPTPPTEIGARLAVRGSAPDWLVEAARARFSDEEAAQFLDALNTPSPLWLRANLLRTGRAQAMAALAEERPSARVSESALVPEAMRVEGAGDLTQLGLFSSGQVTAQDLAAQLVARLVGPRAGERILDACAGVGGKATHLAELSDDRAQIDAADLSERKLELCADSAHRLGLASVRTVRCDLTDPQALDGAGLSAHYDALLLDAPCSGFGVLRRHPEAKWRRGLAEVEGLAALQARLLAALAPRVRPGGRLVYSVCTFTDEEGPLQIEAFLRAHPEFSVAPSSELAGVVSSDLFGADGALRTWPHRHDADAFYAVRLRRIG